MPTTSPGCSRGEPRRNRRTVAATHWLLAAAFAVPAVAAAEELPAIDAASGVGQPAAVQAAPEPSEPTATNTPASAAPASAAIDASQRGSTFDELSPFEEPPRRLRHLGLMFDLGTMGGGMMSLVYRPMPWLRVHGGGGTNGASPGLKLGAVVAPWQDTGWSFSLDGGYFFPGDVNGLFAAFAGSDYDDSHLLERFDYNFVTLQLGWEIERNDLLFFARGGVGLLWTQLPSEDLGRVSNLSAFVDPTDGSVRALLPSVSIGMIGFL